jgi:hypothetical protein
MKLLHVDYKMLNSISFGSARSPPSGENIMWSGRGSYPAPISCVFARQFWFLLLLSVSLSVLAPQPNECSFEDWWVKVEHSVLVYICVSGPYGLCTAHRGPCTTNYIPTLLGLEE